jgi:hypothetical protein
MSRLIRMDHSGHTTLAEWTSEDAEALAAAQAVFDQQRQLGYLGVVALPGGRAEHVRELPLDADLVILRRPIAGG